ncbi:MAG: hypothetical protein ACLR23_15040 [Clostridia bacterium]
MSRSGWAHHSCPVSLGKFREGDYVIVDYGTTHGYDIVSSNLTIIELPLPPRPHVRSTLLCESFRDHVEHYMLGLGYTVNTAPWLTVSFY